MSNSAAPTTDAGDVHGHDDHGVGHVVPVSLLVAVLGVLLFLTVLTVAASYVDLGHFNIYVAIGIAVIKASFVATFFMHLRWDKPFHAYILFATVFFVALFLTFCTMDSAEYRHTRDEYFKTTGEVIKNAKAGAAATLRNREAEEQGSPGEAGH